MKVGQAGFRIFLYLIRGAVLAKDTGKVRKGSGGSDGDVMIRPGRVVKEAGFRSLGPQVVGVAGSKHNENRPWRLEERIP